MHEIGIDVGCVEIDASPHCAEHGAQRFRTSEAAGIEIEPRDFEPAFFEILIPETANIDIDCFRELTREIINMDAGAAINVRRIFVGEEEDLHAISLVTARPDFSKRPACLMSCRAESRHLQIFQK